MNNGISNPYEEYAVYNKIKCNDGIVRKFFVGWSKDSPLYPGLRGMTRCVHCNDDWDDHNWKWFRENIGLKHCCNEAKTTVHSGGPGGKN